VTTSPKTCLSLVTLALLGLAPVLAAAAGAVTGTVDVRPVRFQDETVVYLKGVAAKRPPARFAIDQQGMKFVPFVLAVAKGDTVEFLNNDGVEHEVYSPDRDGFNLGRFLHGEKRAHTFDKPGVYEIKCSLHPMMQAWVFVGENPFATPLDRRGRFRIEGVPAGTYQLAVWNAHLQVPERTITVADGGTVEQTFSVKP
jgi:plastocyanin